MSRRTNRTAAEHAAIDAATAALVAETGIPETCATAGRVGAECRAAAIDAGHTPDAWSTPSVGDWIAVCDAIGRNLTTDEAIVFETAYRG